LSYDDGSASTLNQFSMSDASDFSAKLEEAIAAERDRQAMAAEADRKQEEQRVTYAQKYRDLVDKLRLEVVPPLFAQVMGKLGISGAPEQLEYDGRNAVRTPGDRSSLVVEFAYNAAGLNVDMRCAAILAKPGLKQPLDRVDGAAHQRLPLHADTETARQLIERMVLGQVHRLVRPH
jgi:hypothetical protein